MDIVRAPKPARRGYLTATVVVGCIAVGITALARAHPAEPSVERSTLTIDSVQRGTMMREVRGSGTLVADRVRWVSAVTSARVERISVEQGQHVAASTILLEMSNPDVQIQALQAEQALSEAQSRYADLSMQLESARLSQEGNVAVVRTLNATAAQDRTVAETLLAKRMISTVENRTKRATAEEMDTRLAVEQKRLALMVASIPAQLGALQQQIARLRALADFQRGRVQSLVVRAGVDGVLQEMALKPGQWVNGGSAMAKIVEPGKLNAVLRIPETQAKDVAVGQLASVDTRNGVVAGHVSRVDLAAQAGNVIIDIALDGALPAGARPDLGVDGTVQLERLSDVLSVGRPMSAADNSTVELFRIDRDGKSATRVQVRLGRTSASRVEVTGGARPGDRLVLSDMSAYENVARIRIR